ncbi:Uncharacterised protein [Mycobacteroides abscessus subsp. abscessus]|nr:Uncharacterised protein [Mycobacteroides abscessus subsp. abscessus]
MVSKAALYTTWACVPSRCPQLISSMIVAPKAGFSRYHSITPRSSARAVVCTSPWTSLRISTSRYSPARYSNTAANRASLVAKQ